MRSKAFALLLASSASLSAIDIAPFIDVLTVRTVHSEGMEFDDLTVGEVDYTQSSLFAILGLVGNDSELMWVPMLNFEHTNLEISTLPLGAGGAFPAIDESLYEISLPNILLYNPSGSRWFHGFYNSIGVASDFDSIDSRDFRLAAGIGSGYQFNDCFALGFGVYGSNLTNDPWFAAGPMFVWMPDENWLVSYFGPRLAVRRNFGDDVRIGLEAAWNGGRWNIETPGTPYDSLEVDFSSLRTGLYYKQRIYDQFWVELGAGYTFANELNIYSNGGRELYPTSLGGIDSAPYFSLALSVHQW